MAIIVIVLLCKFPLISAHRFMLSRIIPHRFHTRVFHPLNLWIKFDEIFKRCRLWSTIQHWLLSRINNPGMNLLVWIPSSPKDQGSLLYVDYKQGRIYSFNKVVQTCPVSKNYHGFYRRNPCDDRDVIATRVRPQGVPPRQDRRHPPLRL